ncbi:MAG: hypothetical protein Q7R52_03005 [archaeon]|nr:hypothetical protein [archaeon]
MDECKKITKIHRKYPDVKHDYRALSCRINKNGNPSDIIFYKLKKDGKSSEGVETYSGKNYIVGSNEKSHSRRYDLNKVPDKLRSLVNKLHLKHNKTKWSNKNKIDLN